jgi:hypothetical protein
MAPNLLMRLPRRRPTQPTSQTDRLNPVHWVWPVILLQKRKKLPPQVKRPA